MKSDVATKSGIAVRSEAPKTDAGQRPALAVDAEARRRHITRLRRIEGQVRGLQGMVEEDRYCSDILEQIASAHEALRAVARELMRDHLKRCAAHAVQSGPQKADAVYDELIDLMHKYSR